MSLELQVGGLWCLFVISAVCSEPIEWKRRLSGALTSCMYTIVGFERRYDQVYVRENVIYHLNSTYCDGFWHICIIWCT